MKRLLPVLLLLCLLLTGCSRGEPSPAPAEPAPPAQEVLPPAPPEDPVPPEPPEPPQSPADPRQETIDALLSSMTTEEKVGQLFFVRCPAEDAAAMIRDYSPGGLLLFGRDFKDKEDAWLTAEAFTAAVDGYQQASALPLLIGVDEEGGSVARATRNPNLFPRKRPSPQQLYAQGGMEAILEDAKAVHEGLLSYGINVNLAPVCDISEDRDSFIYSRTFGGDAEATADYVAQVVPVMTACGVGSVLKHFPGYGSTADTHTGEAVDERPLEAFREKDLLPFIAGIQAGAGAVLVSHNRIPAMDPDLPASLSPAVHRLLREDLGFQGVSITDDLDMGAVTAYTEEGSAAVLAILAGNDLLITGNCAQQIPQVLEALQSGEISLDRIDAAAGRVLGWKYDLGLIGPLETDND